MTQQEVGNTFGLLNFVIFFIFLYYLSFLKNGNAFQKECGLTRDLEKISTCPKFLKLIDALTKYFLQVLTHTYLICNYNLSYICSEIHLCPCFTVTVGLKLDLTGGGRERGALKGK